MEGVPPAPRIQYRRIPDPTKPAKPAAVRPTVAQEPLDPLFEDDPRPSTIITQPVPDVNLGWDILIPLGGFIVCIGILWFGIFNAGGFYTTGTRLEGDLARIFYVWQVGNLMEIAGVVGGWECLKKLIQNVVTLRKSYS